MLRSPELPIRLSKLVSKFFDKIDVGDHNRKNNISKSVMDCPASLVNNQLLENQRRFKSDFPGSASFVFQTSTTVIMYVLKKFVYAEIRSADKCQSSQ